MGDIKKVLLTGRPGVGKTTLIKKIAEALKEYHPVGFYTEEIREKGMREGFEWVSLDGRRGLLSHKKIKSPYRVREYGVDVKGFDDFLNSVPWTDPSTRLIIIDEIGKMECFSDQFKKILKEVLDSKKGLIATIAIKGSGLIAEVKGRKNVKLFTMTPSNRDSLLSETLKNYSSLAF
ncbi:MAG: NTPase [Deltaproteobacteria bacterium]|nr:NTPase [Deltaproteobacteria bacterium]